MLICVLAPMAELVDARDLKSLDHWSCRFDSGWVHQELNFLRLPPLLKSPRHVYSKRRGPFMQWFFFRCQDRRGIWPLWSAKQQRLEASRPAGNFHTCPCYSASGAVTGAGTDTATGACCGPPWASMPPIAFIDKRRRPLSSASMTLMRTN